MKKFFIALFVVVIVSLGIILIVARSSSNDNFVQKSYSSSGKEISSIKVDVEDREVVVSESADDQIHIDYYESEKEQCNLMVNENNELIFKLIYNKDWIDYFRAKPSENYRKIVILVPSNLLNSIEITTTNETIKLNNISVVESIILNSNGGNVEFGSVSVGKQINLTAKNGNITGSVVGSWDDYSIFCTIKKGECNLPTNKEGGTKSLIANCNNGDININFI